MRGTWVWVLALGAASAWALGPLSPAPAAAQGDQFPHCGVPVVFLNPDLRPGEDGLVHASGWFFIQFQVIAEDPSFTVDRLAFSFGKPIPESMRTCEAPAWITGAYYQDYRVDDDPADGFFIPINTTNVPDGEYAAAIHIYAGDEEVGRMFTTAVVENGCQLAGCRDRTIDQIRANDAVRPWPIVLPGDGQAIDAGGRLTIEFAEPVQNVRAVIDGEEVILEEAEPRLWDDDTVASAADEDAPACPACRERAWGPAWRSTAPVPEGAVVAVYAEDKNNNTVSKILHTSSTTVGGVISVQAPDVQFRVEEAVLGSDAGQAAEFEVLFQNIGKDEAHTDLHVHTPEGVEAGWRPEHIVIGSGEEAKAVLQASAAEPGTYEIVGSVVYKAGTEDVEKDVSFTLVVGGGGNETKGPDEAINATRDDNATGGGDEGVGSPGPSAALAVMTVALVALGRRWRSS